jgi:hypothetical protein
METLNNKDKEPNVMVKESLKLKVKKRLNKTKSFILSKKDTFLPLVKSIGQLYILLGMSRNLGHISVEITNVADMLQFGTIRTEYNYVPRSTQADNKPVEGNNLLVSRKSVK